MSKGFFNWRMGFPVSNLILFLTVLIASHVSESNESSSFKQIVQVAAYIVVYAIGYINGVNIAL